jgi:DNA-binding protein H-NS
MSKKFDFDSMSIDEMWQLHEKIIQILSTKLTSEKRALEKRLAKLHRKGRIPPPLGLQDPRVDESTRQRRKYPPVFPKYRNPQEPSETWSGRGRQPRWLTTALTTGHAIEEFAIANAEADGDRVRRQRA